MKSFGKCAVTLKGRPDAQVRIPPAVERLTIPRKSRRLNFSTTCVADGALVRRGTVLALDPAQYSVPMLSPCPGVVRTNLDPDHIIIENITGQKEGQADREDFDFPHAQRSADTGGKIRYRLVRYGAWQFLQDTHGESLPDPSSSPQAVIISMLNLEPFSTRGDVLIRQNLSAFTRGLEHIQSLLEYQPIYLAFPHINSELARTVRETLRGYAWIKLVEIPLRYPCDNFRLIARTLGLKPSLEKGRIWALRTEGVIAIDRVLTSEESIDTIVVAVGGPDVAQSTHVKVPYGYPLPVLRDFCGIKGLQRLIAGGVYTGRMIENQLSGIGYECTGITVIPESTERTFLGFMQPGFSKHSYSRTFFGTLFPSLRERATTALQGELRPCISCGFCAEVCPARIAPLEIHKLMFRDNIDEAATFRPDLCIGCGLCSYVCPSKINLFTEIAQVNARVREELLQEQGGVHS